ncbi:MAG: DNA-deoxyinosine glycosylase [Lachnospiraceae bacterium]
MKNASEYHTIEHNFEPVFNAQSQILILGSLPSVKSRENNFYYGHPQNRFWKLIATLCQAGVPQTIEEKKKLLYDHKIAVWDVIAKCDIIGSSDSTIKNVVPNDMQIILDHAPIKRIYANGGKAYELYMRYCYPYCKREIIKLPSTSPANAAFSMDKLLMVWSDAIPLKRI